MFHPESNPLAPKSSGPKKPEKELVRVWLGDAAAAEMEDKESKGEDEGLKFTKKEAALFELMNISNRAFAEAERHAKQDPSDFTSAVAYIALGKALAEAGKNPMKAFRQARRQLDKDMASHSGALGDDTLLNLALAFIKTGHLEEAKAIAKELPPNRHVEFYSALGVALAKRGQDPTEAFHIAEDEAWLQVEEGAYLSWCTGYIKLGSALAEAGLDPSYFFAEVESRADDSWILAELGAAKTKAGLDGKSAFDAAVKQVDDKDPEDDNNNHSQIESGRLSYLIETMAEVGLIDMALENVKSLEFDDDRAKAYGHIAEAQAKAGLLEQARETIKKITDHASLSDALSALAKAESKAGLDPSETLARAEHLAEGLSMMLDHEDAFAELAKALIETGRFQAAFETIERMEYDLHKSKSFSLLAAAAYRAAHKV